MRKLIDKLPFDMAARVPIQLGRESISSSTVAISELIKNSYDAGAEKARLDFLEVDNGEIVISDISDVGKTSGMSMNDIRYNWLVIGTSNKTKVTKSNGRKQTGAKGLGRLGADRLCTKLKLITKISREEKGYSLIVDWGKYEDEGSALSEIKHELYEVGEGDPDYDKYFGSGVFSSGTCLVLTGLKDFWGNNEINKLEKELSLLVPPFDNAIDFEILIRNRDGIWSEVAPSPILEAAAWKVNAEISESGEVSITAINNELDKVHKIGPVPWREWIKDRAEKPECGPLSFEFYYVPWAAPNMNDLDFKKRDWREFMDSHQGVRIYRDFFRVRPYGEPSGKGDWLDLGLRKSKSPGGIRQGGWRVGPHQIVGAVFIGRDENPELKDQTNREGLVEGAAFSDLRAFSQNVIQIFESRAHDDALESQDNYNYEKEREEVRRKEKNLEEKLKSATNDFSKDKMEEITTAFNEYKKQSRGLQKAVIEKTKKLEDEKNTLSNLASLGILTVSFGHEAREHAALAKSDANWLLSQSKKNKIIVDDSIKGEFGLSINNLVASTEFIRSFSAFALSNIAIDKRSRNVIFVPRVVESVFSALDKSLRNRNIEYEVNYDRLGKYLVKAFEIDLESVFVNLITNSIWAMEKVEAEKRRIVCDISISAKSVLIKFSDTGRGIEKGTELDIFKPMFSTKRDSTGILNGTGMGLAITKTFIVDHCGGKIDILSPGSIGGATFMISLPCVK